MYRWRWPILLSGLCLLQAWLIAYPRPLLLVRLQTPQAPKAVNSPLEDAFTGSLTADDVVRGLSALAAGQGPGLSAEQAKVLGPLVQQGAVQRRQLEELREQRRQQTKIMLGDGSQIVALLPRAQRDAITHGTGR